MSFLSLVSIPATAALSRNLDSLIVAARMQRAYAPEAIAILDTKLSREPSVIPRISTILKDALLERLRVTHLIYQGLIPSYEPSPQLLTAILGDLSNEYQSRYRRTLNRLSSFYVVASLG